MPATAPDVTGTANQNHSTIRYIDWTGDKVADSLRTAVAATAAQREALKDAIGAASSANVYEVDAKLAFVDVPDSGDAVEAPRGEVSNVLNILMKNAAGDSDTFPLRAPINDMFISGTDDIDPDNAELGALFTALLALKGAGWEIVSVRYTGRKQTNKATPI